MSGCDSTRPQSWAVGDAVIVSDHSSAHGDKGTIWKIQADGLILVDLEQGCVWPVTADELRANKGV